MDARSQMPQETHRKMRDVRKFGVSENGLYGSRFFSHAWNFLRFRGTFSVIAIVISMLSAAVVAQQTHPQYGGEVTIKGNVVNSAGKSIGDASVWLEQEGTLKRLGTKTDAAGGFGFTAIPPGRYLLSAEKSGQKSHGPVVLALAQGERKDINLILEVPPDTRSDSTARSQSPAQSMEFADKPNFAIAGVTDWTAVGGHGSDSALRTSEDLARATLTLKPDHSNSLGPTSPSDPGKETDSESKLRAGLAAAPGSFDGNHQLGEFYLRAGRYRDSIPLLQAAYQIDPAMDDNTHDLARAYNEVGDYSRALEYVQRYKRTRTRRSYITWQVSLMRSWAIRWLPFRKTSWPSV